MTFRAHFFTGTGNAERALDKVRLELEAKGIGMDARPITKDSGSKGENPPDALLIVSSVLAFSPPAMVKSFLRRLPSGLRADGSRIRAAVLTIDGGGPMGAPWRAASILERRGYDPRFVGSASYPDNWTQLIEPPEQSAVTAMTAAGDSMAAAFGKALASDDPSAFPPPIKPPFASGIVPLLFGIVGRRVFGKIFIADSDCNACGLCERSCPAGTIVMRGAGIGLPYWKSNCENCNRCINICPKKAIVTSIGRALAIIIGAVGFSWAGIAAHAAFAAPLIDAALPAWISFAFNVAGIAAIIVLAHLVALALDRVLLRRIQRLPGLRRFFEWAFNKRTRRYTAEGWRP